MSPHYVHNHCILVFAFPNLIAENFKFEGLGLLTQPILEEPSAIVCGQTQVQGIPETEGMCVCISVCVCQWGWRISVRNKGKQRPFPDQLQRLRFHHHTQSHSSYVSSPPHTNTTCTRLHDNTLGATRA